MLSNAAGGNKKGGCLSISGRFLFSLDWTKRSASFNDSLKFYKLPLGKSRISDFKRCMAVRRVYEFAILCFTFLKVAKRRSMGYRRETISLSLTNHPLYLKVEATATVRYLIFLLATPTVSPWLR